MAWTKPLRGLVQILFLWIPMKDQNSELIVITVPGLI